MKGKRFPELNSPPSVYEVAADSGRDNDDYVRFVFAASKFSSGRIVVAKDLMEVSP
jgi:hypothetical protein